MARQEANVSRQRTTPTIPHPALVEHAQERARNIQNRIADRITAYAGSMHFVYLHVLLFAVWMLAIEKSPWPTLTLIEAIHRAIEANGHRCIDVEADEDAFETLRGLRGWIDLVFNIAEGRRGQSREAQMPAMLEMLDIRSRTPAPSRMRSGSTRP